EGPDDPLPPGNWANFTPASWTNAQTVDSTVQVEDTVSGLDVATAAYAYSTDGGGTWSDWRGASCTGSDGTTTPQTITAAAVRFGQDSGPAELNRVKFRIADRAGNVGESPPYSVRVDTVPPGNPTSLSCPAHPPSTWSTNSQVTCRWSGASDDRSGVAGYTIDWDHLPSTVPALPLETSHTEVTIPLSDSDSWYLHVRAVDQAGNGAVGAAHSGQIYIDTVPPYSSLSSPSSVTSNSFVVSWTGGDNVSGVAGYDVEYRDTTAGTNWIRWKTQTTATSATFTGAHGHIYQFRSRARDNAGHLEAWPSAYDASTQVATLDFEAFALEVTQAVQDWNNSVVLVSNKRTYVRFHVRSNAHGDQGPVKAALTGWYWGSNLGTILPNNPGGTLTVRQSPDRAQLAHTFYFDVPSSWLSGQVRFQAQVNPDGAWAESNTANNTRTVDVTFQSTPEMNLLLVDICYTVGGTTYHVSNQERQELESWLRAAYPIHKLNTWWGVISPCYAGTVNADGVLTWPSSGEVNSLLSWHHSRKVLGANEDPYTRYYGMVDRGGGFMRGAAPSTPSMVACGPVWPGSGYYGAHELGHAYDRDHTRGTTPPPCGSCSTTACDGTCGCEGGAVTHYSNGDISPTQDPSRADALYGINTGQSPPAVYPPSRKDVMTYCSPEWVSDYTYEGIRDQMLAESGSQAGWERPAQLQEHLAVFGTVYTATNQVQLGFFYRVPDAWDVLGRVPGDYSIRLLDAGGSTLADYPFTPRYDHVDPGPSCQDAAAADNPALITEYVPWVAGATRVAIYHGAQELISRPVSADAPQVRIVYPNGGEALAGDQIRVTWEASDADGDPLEFTVEYSVDGGAHWSPLGSRITGNEVLLDATSVPGTEQGMFRVVASEGVNTAQDESDGTFTVPDRAPQVWIESPPDGALYVPGQAVALVANAMDAEDGIPGDAAFSWSSSLSGALGTGSMLHVTDLITGTHLIMVAVTDSGGRQASSQVTIYVGDWGERVYLPVVLRQSP
ncbi:MAG: fibronectin type III domain-containing protein, partial [Anaerolineae bacterium]